MGFAMFSRSYNSSASVKKSARIIRNEFLDYFRNELGHSFIRSSPVAPLHDPSVPFINAGMNQFKGIFLNYHEPPASKAVNAQKCIRVGGKHNDLKVVGTDGYHHTFFEMLGNWSFGSYSKEDACRYAWNLLTQHYNIKKEYLYVTYFGGEEKLGLAPDLECQDIWLRIGVPRDRILPFGAHENFWEMAITGPCGTCTEIHIDHTKQLTNQSARVNKGLPELTELWNIVFIEYERLNDQSIIPLAKQYIDTGMGLERLVALLQEKKSNYDTDLFQPLFETIKKYTNAPEYKGRFGISSECEIDYGYRVLADHSRAITIALADGMLPEKSPKLRRIIRKSIDTEETILKSSGVLSELSSSVADSLGEFYPELHNNLKEVQQIIQFETEIYKKLKKRCSKGWMEIIKKRPELTAVTEWTAPGLISGYKELQSMLKNFKKAGILPGEFAFKLYDTYGLDTDTIAELAEIESLLFDEAAFHTELNNVKYQSKLGINHHLGSQEAINLLQKNNIPKTDDSLKYEYTFKERYIFPTVKSKILAILVNDQTLLNGEKGLHLSNDIINAPTCGIVLNKTVCYASQGGQKSDKGLIRIKSHVFKITNVEKINDYVIHFGSFLKEDLHRNKEETVMNDDDCEVSIIPEIRMGAMIHHTATHLLHAALGKTMRIVRQRYSAVLPNSLKFQYASFGEQLSLEQLRNAEKLINDVIRANVKVTTKTVNSLEMLNEENLTLVPNEIYPYTGIRIVKIDSEYFRSKEACCGTHVYNTGDIQSFRFLNYSTVTLYHTIEAAVGPAAFKVEQIREDAYNKISALQDKIKNERLPYKIVRPMINQMKQDLSKDTKKEKLPILVKDDCLIKLEKLDKAVWDQEKEVERSKIRDEIKNAADPTLPCIVYCLDKNPEYLSLHEIVSLYRTMPILIFVHNRGSVKARCSIPENLISETFNAQKWMAIVLENFNGKQGPIRGFDPLLVAKMNFQSVADDMLELLMRKVIRESVNFACEHMKESKTGSGANQGLCTNK